jgi:hypothetical protein
MKSNIFKLVFFLFVIFSFFGYANAQNNNSPTSNTWTSNDGTRAVKVMVGSGDAFLYFPGNNSINSVFLTTNAKSVSFTGSGSSLRIVLVLKDGSTQTFEANGSSLNALTTESTQTSVSSSVYHSEIDNQSGKFIIQIQGGADLPLSTNFVSNLEVGEGGELMIGYCINDSFTLGLLSGYHNYNYQYSVPGYISPVSFVPLEAVGQFYLGRGKLRPYLLIGVGICIVSYATSSGYTPGFTYGDFLAEPGFGLSYKISKNINLFAQVKLTMDMGNLPYFPYELVNLYLPIQMGVNFQL